MNDIVFAREPTLSVGDYTAVIGSTYMKDRRPLGNPGRIAAMLEGSHVIVTARDDAGTLLGIARGVSDTAWVCYLADLAVRDSIQGKGIGRGILRACQQFLGPGVAIVLLAFPEAQSIYRKAGLAESAGFFLDRTDPS